MPHHAAGGNEASAAGVGLYIANSRNLRDQVWVWLTVRETFRRHLTCVSLSVFGAVIQPVCLDTGGDFSTSSPHNQHKRDASDPVHKASRHC